MSVRARYCSSRRRRPTSSSRPRRLWWSCLWTLRCSVRSLIRLVSSATWTSGEPVSPSPVACSAMISFFTAVSSGTWHSYRCVWSRVGADGARSCPEAPGQPLEGAADLAGDADHPSRYHGWAADSVPPGPDRPAGETPHGLREFRPAATPGPLPGLSDRDGPRLVHVVPHLLGQ